jgi:hypothetical protein
MYRQHTFAHSGVPHSSFAKFRTYIAALQNTFNRLHMNYINISVSHDKHLTTYNIPQNNSFCVEISV